jgi:RimJ/RimL family protein N-acetyltransferase
MFKNSIITTLHLELRAFEEEDFSLLFSLHNNLEVAKTTIDGIQNEEQIQNHLENFINHQKKYGYSQFAVFEKKSGEFIGRAGITNRALNAEIGMKPEIRFAFLPKFWGNGYASEVTKYLLKFAFEELMFLEVAASSGIYNQASYKVLTKNGFVCVGEIVPSGYGSSDKIKFYLISYQEFLTKNF